MPTREKSTNTLLSAAEAAVRLGLSKRQTLTLIQQQRLPARRIGQSYVIEEADLAKLAPRQVGWPRGRPRKVG